MEDGGSPRLLNADPPAASRLCIEHVHAEGCLPRLDGFILVITVFVGNHHFQRDHMTQSLLGACLLASVHSCGVLGQLHKDDVKLVYTCVATTFLGDIAAFTVCAPCAHVVAGTPPMLPTPSKASLEADPVTASRAGNQAEAQAAAVTEHGNSVVQVLEHQLAQLSLTAGAHFVSSFLLWWLVYASRERIAAARPLQRCRVPCLIALNEPKLGGMLCSV